MHNLHFVKLIKFNIFKLIDISDIDLQNFQIPPVPWTRLPAEKYCNLCSVILRRCQYQWRSHGPKLAGAWAGNLLDNLQCMFLANSPQCSGRGEGFKMPLFNVKLAPCQCQELAVIM